MSAWRRMGLAILVLLLITAVGTVGYVMVEDLTWIDALYMTVITLSTVGYGEVAPLGRAGKLFTVALIVTGVGTALYLLGSIAELLLEGRLRAVFGRDSMANRLEDLSDHVIVCGFGRFGRVVVDELRENGVTLVIVENDPAKEADLEGLGVPYVLGSATSDECLERARVERARALVCATESDAANVFIALSARERQPRIRIHARGESDAAIRRLRLAGANQVVSPYHIGGLRVATSILRPSVVDFLEIARPRHGEPVDLEEVRIDAQSRAAGRTVGWVEAQAPRVRVVAIKRGDDPIRLMPRDETEIAHGDHLVVIGEAESLMQLARRADDSA